MALPDVLRYSTRKDRQQYLLAITWHCALKLIRLSEVLKSQTPENIDTMKNTLLEAVFINCL